MPAHDFPFGYHWRRAVELSERGDFRELAGLIERGLAVPPEHASALADALRKAAVKGRRARVLPVDVEEIRSTYEVWRHAGQAELGKEHLADIYQVSVGTIEDVIYRRGTYK